MKSNQGQESVGSTQSIEITPSLAPICAHLRARVSSLSGMTHRDHKLQGVWNSVVKTCRQLIRCYAVMCLKGR